MPATRHHAKFTALSILWAISLIPSVVAEDATAAGCYKMSDGNMMCIERVPGAAIGVVLVAFAIIVILTVTMVICNNRHRGRQHLSRSSSASSSISKSSQDSRVEAGTMKGLDSNASIRRAVPPPPPAPSYPQRTVAPHRLSQPVVLYTPGGTTGFVTQMMPMPNPAPQPRQGPLRVMNPRLSDISQPPSYIGVPGSSNMSYPAPQEPPAAAFVNEKFQRPPPPPPPLPPMHPMTPPPPPMHPSSSIRRKTQPQPLILTYDAHTQSSG